MGLIDLNLSDVPDQEPVEDKSEHRLSVKSFEVVDKKDGSGKQIAVRFSIDDAPKAPDITHYVGLAVKGQDDEKTYISKMNRVKQLYEVLGLPLTGGFDSEDAKGKSCWAIIGLEETDEYGKQNRIRKFVKGA